jgi:serralysin
MAVEDDPSSLRGDVEDLATTSDQDGRPADPPPAPHAVFDARAAPCAGAPSEEAAWPRGTCDGLTATARASWGSDAGADAGPWTPVIPSADEAPPAPVGPGSRAAASAAAAPWVGATEAAQAVAAFDPPSVDAQEDGTKAADAAADAVAANVAASGPPNIVLILIDDMASLATLAPCFDGPLKLPHLERLMAQGVTFTDTIDSAPLCNPSRASVLTGMSPLASGLFGNTQRVLDQVPASRTLPAQLAAAGYETATAGKVFHSLTLQEGAQLYDTVLSASSDNAAIEVEGDVVWTTSTVRCGIYTGDPDNLADARNVAEVEDFLAGYAPSPDSAGLFLSVGLAGTHSPWVVPQAYYDLYPLEQIRLPPTPSGDLDDVPAFARQFVQDEAFARMVAAGDWPRFVQAYLATVSYVDAMLGRLLDAIAASAIGGDTLIMLAGDNGYHLGQKETIHKETLWAPATQVPMIVVDPAAPERAGIVEERVVGTIDLYPTVLDYAGIDGAAWADGESLRGLIEEGEATGLAGAALTVIEGNLSLRTDRYRYTRYEDGSEELYDIVADPQERVNLAGSPRMADTKAALAARLDRTLEPFAYQANDSTTPRRMEGDHRPDILVAGFGRDTLIGGAGDDVYLLRSAAQLVREERGGGRDSILLSVPPGTYALPLEVENLYLERNGDGVEDASDATLIGNAKDNVITVAGNVEARIRGGVGDDTITNGLSQATVLGGAGDDSFEGGTGRSWFEGGDGLDSASGSERDDSLLGQGGNDQLSGQGGDDRLDGGAGDDSLRGGPGGDLYLAGGGADLVLAEVAGPGMDRVDITAWGRAATIITESRDAAGILLSVRFIRVGGPGRIEVEVTDGISPIEAMLDGNLTILLQPQSARDVFGSDHFEGSPGSDTIDGAGEADALDGMGGDDSLLGGTGHDRLGGGEGRDTLSGGTGNDSLDGGPAADRMLGGEGDDTYFVDMASDITSEAGGSGSDTVFAAIAWTLGPGLEALVLTTGLHGTGNGLDNTLAGNGSANGLFGRTGADSLTGGGSRDTLEGGAGNDSLDGGDGADSLTGGLGADRFHFAAPTEETDTIADFMEGEDRISISSAGFGDGVMPPGPLDPAYLSLDASATGPGPKLVYNAATGSLSWDADGAGGAAALRFAVLATRPLLDATDFVVLA